WGSGSFTRLRSYVFTTLPNSTYRRGLVARRQFPEGTPLTLKGGETWQLPEKSAGCQYALSPTQTGSAEI
ncbi:hypothetical protein, partial [Mycobacteroides abscessus]|uniref:hypothetical protein n=1 Tax=Mycobacteroides abscessus TaxID=36809 RepID=UPI001A971F10